MQIRHGVTQYFLTIEFPNWHSTMEVPGSERLRDTSKGFWDASFRRKHIPVCPPGKGPVMGRALTGTLSAG